MKNKIVLAIILPLLLAVQTGCEREDPMLTLAKATYAGDLETLEKALKHGVSPDSTEEGVPLIVIAIQGHGGIETGRVLLRYGANINYTGNRSDTALMYAAEWGAVGSAKFLLENGADPNIEAGFDGATALFLPTLNGDGSHELAILRMLIAAGADPCHKNHKGMLAQQGPPGGEPTLLGQYVEEECRKKRKQ